MKHTKGEWFVTRHNDLQYSISTDRRGYEERHVNDEEDEANAKLIAASPVLLKSLQWAIKELRALNDKTEQLESINQQLPMAEAAINKATT